MKIIERIFYELEKQHKKDVELAKCLDVTTAQVTMWKKRKTDPPAKYIKQIAELLNISIEYLLTGEEIVTEPNDTELLQSMSFMYERLTNICNKNGISITKLCIEITGSKGNLATWKKGHMMSDQLSKCADYFNCSTDYLLGRTEIPEINKGITIVDGKRSSNAQLAAYSGSDISSSFTVAEEIELGRSLEKK